MPDGKSKGKGAVIIIPYILTKMEEKCTTGAAGCRSDYLKYILEKEANR